MCCLPIVGPIDLLFVPLGRWFNNKSTQMLWRAVIMDASRLLHFNALQYMVFKCEGLTAIIAELRLAYLDVVLGV